MAAAPRELGGGGERDRGGVFDLLFSLILWLGETNADGDLGDWGGGSATCRWAMTAAATADTSWSEVKAETYKNRELRDNFKCIFSK